MMSNCDSCDEYICLVDEKYIVNSICTKFERILKYKNIEFLTTETYDTTLADLNQSMIFDKDKLPEGCKQRFDDKVSEFVRVLTDCSLICGNQLAEIKDYLNTVTGFTTEETKEQLTIIHNKTKKKYKYDKFLEDECAFEDVQAFIEKMTK
jgi:hypothetical protein